MKETADTVHKMDENRVKTLDRKRHFLLVAELRLLDSTVWTHELLLVFLLTPNSRIAQVLHTHGFFSLVEDITALLLATYLNVDNYLSVYFDISFFTHTPTYLFLLLC